ncbi:acyltransferase family protein [Thermomonas sp.]|uniref:acyltransferase family protein n=1 Tax=Thermomonas sp. TaxID=1971895 RepID=UPI00391883AD
MSTAYKPEIDGLRAIAVLAVVGFHAGFGPPAGFVGVDVFFVISGYLITRMLRQEVLAHQRIDIIDFYARRARRILPALLVVTVATLLASAALLPPAELRQTVQAGAAAFAFAANVFFATAANGYFDPEAHANPLLHLWSIGVEEQFYLAWPLVVLLARRRPALVFGLIAAASFAAAEWLLAHGQDRAAFYQAPMRAWELAAGGLVAVNRIPARPWVAPLGIVVVLVACLVPLARFPGTGALLPVVGASMVIAGVHAGQRNALLASRPLVLVGLVSYSLYLWHWPVMVLGKALPVWLQVAAALAAAAASYRWIEQPLRRTWVRPARQTVAAATSAIAVLCASALVLASELPKPTPAKEQAAATRARLIPIYDMGCDGWYESAQVVPCVFGDKDGERTVVMLGDSVVMQWFPAVRRIFDRPGWRLVVLTKSSCPMVDAAFYYERIGGVFTKCAEWRDGALQWLDRHHPDLVITGSANSYGFSGEQWVAGTRSVLERAAAAAGSVALMRSTPLLRVNGQEAYDNVRRWELEAMRGIPNVSAVDMNPFVCPAGACDRAAYFDRRHIAAALAESLTPHLDARFRRLVPGTAEPIPGQLAE